LNEKYYQITASRIFRSISARTTAVSARIVRRVVGLIHNWIPSTNSNASFSQCGEDIIVDFIFKQMQIIKPSYLDIGANHPFIFNNTYFFYRLGCKGVSVEPHPTLHELLLRKRPKETQLKVGVSKGGVDTLPFFVMSNLTLSTFSEIDACRYSESGVYWIKEILNIDVIPISEIFEKYFNGHAPDFISIDVEGIDIDIIKSIDFIRYRPVVICVETLIFSDNRDAGKVPGISEFLSERGYIEYADTHINTIFVDRVRWLMGGASIPDEEQG
jgi:FkbM family methyltransferase